MKEIVLLIKNDEIICPWWCKEAAELLCRLCKHQQGSEECETCLNKNPYCG